MSSRGKRVKLYEYKAPQLAECLWISVKEDPELASFGILKTDAKSSHLEAGNTLTNVNSLLSNVINGRVSDNADVRIRAKCDYLFLVQVSSSDTCAALKERISSLLYVRLTQKHFSPLSFWQRRSVERKAP